MHTKSRPLHTRQRALSETSDTTIVPATFTRSDASTRHARSTNHPVQSARDATTSRDDSSTPSPLVSSKSEIAHFIPENHEEAAGWPTASARHQQLPQSITEEVTLSPRALQSLLVTLQLTSLVPALVGSIYCLYRATQVREIAPLHPYGKQWVLRWNRRLEWLLCAMWASLSGSYCHSMSRGLTRRWLVYYPLPAAVIRLVSLQVICWPLTKFTVVNFFGKEELQLPAWIVCAITAAISNTVQIWVTSNLRFLLVSGASSHPASWASRLPATQRYSKPTPPSSVSPAPLHAANPSGSAPGFVLPRGLRSKQVIKQTVLPIATCSFVTLLWALIEVYNSRGSELVLLVDRRSKQL